MKTRKTFAFVALCCCALWANAQKLTSPDGNLVMDFSLNDFTGWESGNGL